MNLEKPSKRVLSLLLSLSLFFVSLQSSLVQAAMVGTETKIRSEQVHYDQTQLLQRLQQDDARQVLKNLGVNSEDLEQRVKAMTSEELAQFNAQVNDLPAGGTSIFGVVIFILLLLIVLDLLGATDVFPAIRPINSGHSGR